MTAGPWTIDIPFGVPSMNTRERMHWRAQRREVAKATHLLCACGLAVPRATGKRLVAIFSYRRQRCLDHANLVGGCKGLIDAMVRVGLLVDDRIELAYFTYDQAVLGAMPPDVLARFGRKPCTRLVVQDAAN
jgi:hypothetical protein